MMNYLHKSGGKKENKHVNNRFPRMQSLGMQSAGFTGVRIQQIMLNKTQGRVAMINEEITAHRFDRKAPLTNELSCSTLQTQFRSSERSKQTVTQRISVMQGRSINDTLMYFYMIMNAV